MNSSELNDRVAELERSAGGRLGKVLPVKVRIAVGDRVMVMDLEPGMLTTKGWGSEPEPAVILLDLT
jgi:hypothetical protein